MRENAMKVAQDVFQEIGEVVSGDGDSLTVETTSGRFEARRAASCLLAPAHGDRVLLAVPKAGPLYVLAVLDRDPSAPAEVRLGDDARLVAGRRVVLAADEDVGLRAGGTVHASGDRVQLDAREAVFAFGEATWRSRALELWVDVARSLSKKIESHVESLTVHAKTSVKIVEGADITRAGTIEAQAEGTVHLRGENAFVSAEELVKVDGELIHLG